MAYQFMLTNLVKFVNYVGFGKEKYFFIFINKLMHYTKVYTKTRKNNWF